MITEQIYQMTESFAIPLKWYSYQQVVNVLKTERHALEAWAYA